MNAPVLSIECSSELCSVALSYSGNTLSKEKIAPREHAYLVLPFAQSLLKDSGLDFTQLNTVCFGQGPGAFTGLRVAASIAQGLALAHDLELRGYCSLKNLAMVGQENLLVSEGACIWAVLDARMNELYWAQFRVENGQLTCVREAQLGSAKILMSQLDSEPAYFVGPGCRHLLDKLNEANCCNFQTLVENAETFPQAKFLSKIHLEEKYLLDENSRSGEVEQLALPVYIRNQVAAKAKA